MDRDGWLAVVILIIILIIVVLLLVILAPHFSTASQQVGIEPGSRFQNGWQGTCQIDSDCAGELLCSDGFCKQPLGGPCNLLSDCALPANNCAHSSGARVGQCIQLAAPTCNLQQSCPPQTAPTYDQYGNCVCKGVGGAVCQRAEQCKSGNCLDGYCTMPLVLGQACEFGQCQEGLHCSRGYCQPQGVTSGTEGAYCDMQVGCQNYLSCDDNQCVDYQQQLLWLDSCSLRSDRCKKPWRCLQGHCRLSQAPEVALDWGQQCFTIPSLNQERVNLPQQLLTQELKVWADRYLLTNRGLYWYNDQEWLLLLSAAFADIAWDSFTNKLWVVENGKPYILSYHPSTNFNAQLLEYNWSEGTILQLAVHNNQIAWRDNQGYVYRPGRLSANYKRLGKGSRPQWLNADQVVFINECGQLASEDRILAPQWFNKWGAAYENAQLVNLVSDVLQQQILMIIKVHPQLYWIGIWDQGRYDTLPWAFTNLTLIKIQNQRGYIIDGLRD